MFLFTVNMEELAISQTFCRQNSDADERRFVIRV